LALDTGTLIELIFSTPRGLKLKEALEKGLIEAYATEISIAELRYILCRRLGLAESKERVDKLLASGYVVIEDTTPLIEDASRYKCERSISLADCFSLALAQKTFCNALFAKREEELNREIQRKAFDVEVLFLEDYE